MSRGVTGSLLYDVSDLLEHDSNYLSINCNGHTIHIPTNTQVHYSYYRHANNILQANYKHTTNTIHAPTTAYYRHTNNTLQAHYKHTTSTLQAHYYTANTQQAHHTQTPCKHTTSKLSVHSCWNPTQNLPTVAPYPET